VTKQISEDVPHVYLAHAFEDHETPARPDGAKFVHPLKALDFRPVGHGAPAVTDHTRRFVRDHG
jgi:hypothetical protein